MKVAVVVQRYGNEVVGGAETHSRKIAEKLKTDLDWDVEVITTTALDYRTWANYFPTGVTFVNGIRVRRFPNLMKRAWFFNAFHRLCCRYLPALERRSWLRWGVRPIERLWYVLQGPYSPSLIRYLKEHGEEYRAIFFFTYLYYPTVAGISLFPDKSFLIPEAHDEPPFYFRGTADALRSARRIFANTPAEARLITRRLNSSANKTELAGMGIDISNEHPIPSFELKVDSLNPYILYMGRVDSSKHVHILIENFLQHIQSHSSSRLQLVLAGGKDENFSIPDHPQIHYLGFVSESEKTYLIRNALCMVNPSAYESLSIIVAEAMTLCKPVMVNGHCEVLRDYKDLSESTIFPYFSGDEFSRHLDTIFDTPWSQDACKDDLLRGKVAIDDVFSWKKILNSYQQALLDLTEKR